MIGGVIDTVRLSPRYSASPNTITRPLLSASQWR
jgi:hypothetical protein